MNNRLKGKVLHVAFWWVGPLYTKDVPKGYSPQTPELMQSLRVGPLIVSWEVSEES